ncbi:MAG: T9SS type A sorting domain-containing protein, partial [bacterium]|nr:T9SS type A sorting domain-containing protein [bacterium]
DSLLYIADLGSIWPVYSSAFSVYNVADPVNPSLWGRFVLVAYVADVKVHGDYAYVSNGSCGLQVFDISDPTAPDSVGRYLAPSDWVNGVQSFAGRTAIQGDLLFLADIGPGMIGAEATGCYPTVPEPGDPSPGDLIILDISNPTQPTLVSHYTPDSLPTDVDEDEPDGLPASFALHQNYPNPFNPMTTVRFDLPRRSEIVLTVYNLLGQEISRKVETRSAGHHTLELDLKDQPSGVYLYKLQANDFSETR